MRMDPFPGVEYPVGHAVQVTVPVKLAYRPCGQSKQDGDARPGAYVPSGQYVKCVTFDIIPAGAGRQRVGEVAPVEAAKSAG